MLASWSGGGAVAWVEPSGPAVVEGFAVGGNIAADPLSLPFVDAELEDIAAGEHEIDVLLVTRADRSATPATTTLVRLTPELRSDSPLVAPPVRVPLSHARMLRVGSDELLLLGEGDTQLAVAHCAS
jgi:hypothetical protein